MQSYKTNQVGDRASQVGGIAWIVKENERNLEPSGMAVATSSIMNIKLKILVIESRIKYLQ